MNSKGTYAIGELAQRASVTTRTVRYYVSQGLLPPPHGGGRAAHYSDRHLHRLELIKLLKEEFLPLNEIKSLLDGIDDDAMHKLLTERRKPAPAPAPETAREYLRALINPPKSGALLRHVAAAQARRPSMAPPSARPLAAPAEAKRLAQAAPSSMESIQRAAQAPPSPKSATVWQRYRLHPDLELHVRQPPTDAGLSAQLERLIGDIRRVIEKHNRR